MVGAMVMVDRSGRRRWNAMSDRQLVDFAKEFVRKFGICHRSDLAKADVGLHNVLYKRGLFSEVGFEINRGKRPWSSMPDEELISHAQDTMDRAGISSRYGLRAHDSGLYTILWRRDLLERIDFKDRNIDWSAMGEEGLLDYVGRLVDERSITSISQLRRIDRRLLNALQRRGLLDKVKGRNGLASKVFWTRMDDEELIASAKRIIEEEGIGRQELKRLKGGLYSALQERGLINEAFSDSRRSEEVKALKEVVDALGEFG